MQREGIEPDSMTLVGVLNSCANFGALRLGEWVHSYIDKCGSNADGIVGNALVDMYAKCGRIDKAVGIFNAMTIRDVHTYTAMVVGLAMHGKANKALDLFSEMLSKYLKPNGVTFIGVLMACSHAGLVDAGLDHLSNMWTVHRIKPQIEHYGCVVDMLGQAGLLHEAHEFIERMPLEPDVLVWGNLLGACRLHGNVPLGDKISRKLLEVEPDEDAGYLLMTSIYASANQRGDERRMRKLMKKKKVKKKTPGCSLIEVDGIVHEFRMKDRSHPRRGEVYIVAEEMCSHHKCQGCECYAIDVFE